MYEIWLWFTKKLSMAPIYHILGTNLIEIFHKALNNSSIAMEDTIARATFMHLCGEVTSDILDQISLAS